MPSKTSSGPRILYWFRTDLRIHDSPALTKALALSPSALFPVFCWDPSYIYKHRVGINRFRFLLESLEDLSDEIKKLNKESQLLLVRGEPQSRIAELCKKWEITHVAFEEDYSGYAPARDAKVRETLEEIDVQVISQEGRHLYPVKQVLEKHGGKPVGSITALQHAVSSLGGVHKPYETPKSIPSPTLPGGAKTDLKKLYELIRELDSFAKTPGAPAVDLNSAEQGGQRKEGQDGKVTCYDTVAGEDSDPFAVPTLASLGMELPSVQLAEPIRGGTKEALRRLDLVTKDPKYLATFAKPKTSPCTDPDGPSTTMLSPYIKFGCIGIRHLWWVNQETKKKYSGGGKTDIPEGMEGQLFFRDMYAVDAAALGEPYEHQYGNSMARYFDWYLADEYDKDGNKIEPRPRGDDVSEARLAAFKTGQTGFPWIDALMRQLRMTGWIHHLGRHSVACFLTRGQCWISWERGAAIFDEYLIDWDPASNAGNWMWLACAAYQSKYYQVYGLSTWPSRYDKTGYLVRKYCPELKDYPDKYIYTPHEAPLDVQKKAGCIIGKDYPAPMLDEKEEKAHCQTRCKAVYALKYHGDSKEVLEGKATDLIRKEHGVPEPKEYKFPERKSDKM